MLRRSSMAVAAATAILLCAASAHAGSLALRETTTAWGIDVVHHDGASGRFYMVETMVGGVAAFDYDGDGDADLLFVDGGVLPGYRGPPPRTRLLRNDGGRFVDRTEQAGIATEGFGAGAVAGDVDGDGDLDLYLTAFGPDRLLRNRGDGSFEDVTAEAGLGDPRWSSSATFFDPDRDGDLDLYVAAYVDFTIAGNVDCGDPKRGISGYCHPDAYRPLPDRYYENQGSGTFVDRTRDAGLAVAPGSGLGVVAADLDDDGWSDLYVANDLTPNYLFRNRGADRERAAGDTGTGARFEDLSLLSGTSYSDQGRPEAGMGIAVGDIDGSGQLDLFITNFALETNALYLNAGGGVFLDRRFRSGIAEPSLLSLGFGTAFSDLDLDGDLDLVVANGHINPTAEALGSPSPYKQRNQLFENLGQGRFRERTDAGLDASRASRGLALADLDLDGDPDLVVTNVADRAAVYDNRSTGRWLGLRFTGRTGAPHGIGTRMTVITGTRRQTREVSTGTSYLSHHELTQHIGLGDAPRIDSVRLRFADGRVRVLRGLPVNLRLTID